MFKTPALMLMAALPMAALADDITLSCQGQGWVAATQTNTVQRFHAGKPGHFQPEVVTIQTRRNFKGTGSVEIKAGAARMRVPDAMVPVLMSGGTEGWYPIEDLTMADAEITGVVRVGLLSQPKLRIDRMTGKLSLSGGAGDYTADCGAGDAGPQPKF